MMTIIMMMIMIMIMKGGKDVYFISCCVHIVLCLLPLTCGFLSTDDQPHQSEQSPSPISKGGQHPSTSYGQLLQAGGHLPRYGQASSPSSSSSPTTSGADDGVSSNRDNDSKSSEGPGRSGERQVFVTPPTRNACHLPSSQSCLHRQSKKGGRRGGDANSMNNAL